MGNLQSLDNRNAGLSKAELERMERRWAGLRRCVAVRSCRSALRKKRSRTMLLL